MDTNSQLDRLFDCLSHGHRRTIVDVLRSSDTPQTPVELADAVVETIPDASTGDPSSPVEIRTSLYHVHLLKLADAGLVEYDEENDVVAPIDRRSLPGTLVDVAELIADGHGCPAHVGARDRDDERITG